MSEYPNLAKKGNFLNLLNSDESEPILLWAEPSFFLPKKPSRAFFLPTSS